MNEERFVICGLKGKQYVYWLFLESKVVHPQALANTKPLEEVIVWRN